MNTLAPLFIVLAMLIVTVVFVRLMQSLSTAQHAGNTLALGIPGFVSAGSPEHQPEDGAS
jgi:hypothetical protein